MTDNPLKEAAAEAGSVGKKGKKIPRTPQQVVDLGNTNIDAINEERKLLGGAPVHWVLRNGTAVLEYKPRQW